MATQKTSCSFCGLPREEVKILIAGVTGHICENCAKQANQIVAEEFEVKFEESTYEDTWFGQIKATQHQQETTAIHTSIQSQNLNQKNLHFKLKSDGPFMCLFCKRTVTSASLSLTCSRSFSSKFITPYQQHLGAYLGMRMYNESKKSVHNEKSSLRFQIFVLEIWPILKQKSY